MVQKFNEWGMKVPEDIAVIGFDNTDYARNVGLSSVEQPLVTRGNRMMEVLIERMNGHTHHDSIISAPTKLIIRHSCGCTLVSKEECILELYNESLGTIEYLQGIVSRNQYIGRDLIRSQAGHYKM
jgi:hypothetical protein